MSINRHYIKKYLMVDGYELPPIDKEVPFKGHFSETLLMLSKHSEDFAERLEYIQKVVGKYGKVAEATYYGIVTITWWDWEYNMERIVILHEGDLVGWFTHDRGLHKGKHDFFVCCRDSGWTRQYFGGEYDEAMAKRLDKEEARREKRIEDDKASKGVVLGLLGALILPFAFARGASRRRTRSVNSRTRYWG